MGNGRQKRTSKTKVDRKDETPKEITSLKPDGKTKMEMEDQVTSIVSYQESNGSFQPKAELAIVLGSSLEASIKKQLLNTDQAIVWTTYLVTNLLKQHFQSVKDLWELVVDKAEAWLNSSKFQLNDIQQNEAKTFIENIFNQTENRK